MSSMKQKLTVSTVNVDLTIGIISKTWPAFAETITMYDANVKRDLLWDGCRPPSNVSNQFQKS